MQIYRANDYIKDQFGEKLYKLSLSSGCTCPNRDGSISYGGCIFCSGKGSGDFGGDFVDPISVQIEKEKQRMKCKSKSDRYIAYFQSYTNTYGDIDRLRELYMETARREDVAVIDIATRPDCINEDVISMLEELSLIKPVWVELGLQTVNEKTANIINRGYELSAYDSAVNQLKKIPVHIIVHMIIGLPGETEEDMISTTKYISDSGVHGIKLQLLHVLAGTKLADMYEAGAFKTLELEEYGDILIKCLSAISPDMVVHRITGDGPKSILISPLWSGDKKKTLNYINKCISEAN